METSYYHKKFSPKEFCDKAKNLVRSYGQTSLSIGLNLRLFIVIGLKVDENAGGIASDELPWKCEAEVFRWGRKQNGLY